MQGLSRAHELELWFLVTDCIATPSRSCPLFMVTLGLQNVTWKLSKSGHSHYRKRVDWYCRPNGMVYKNEGFLRHFGPVSRRSHGDSRNHISKMEHVFGRIRWLLCVPFRESKKCHRKLTRTHRHEEKMQAIFAKWILLFVQKDYLQIKQKAKANV